MSTFKLLYVYIAECADGMYYTGVTNNPDRRLEEHNAGLNPKSFTYKRRPVKMVYWQAFNDFDQAIHFETQIKKWSHQKKKAFIESQFDRLKELSECRNQTHAKNYKKPE